MKFEDLKNLAEQGKLKLEKHNMGKTRRIKYIRNEETFEITGHKYIEYTKYQYTAKIDDMKENEFWKITKKDYQILNEINKL